MHKQVSDRKMAANQPSARKSTGPKTKARTSLNSFKHGAYARLDTRHRELPKPECTIDEQSGHISENKDDGRLRPSHHHPQDFLRYQPEDSKERGTMKGNREMRA